MTEEKAPDCSTAGKGFAREENSGIESESCGLPERGFGVVDAGGEVEEAPTDCSTAGKGFARTDDEEIVAEDCAFPRGSFATTESDEKK